MFFALGCVLYEALARKPAYTGQLSEIVARIEGREVRTAARDRAWHHPGTGPHDPPRHGARSSQVADRYQDLETLRQELAGLRRGRGRRPQPHHHRPIRHTAPAPPTSGRPRGGGGCRGPPGLRRIVRWAAPIAIALTVVGAVWWQVIRSNAPSGDAGNLAPAPPAASAPTPAPACRSARRRVLPPCRSMRATMPGKSRAGRTALIGADRATTLKLLREQQALAASVMAEVTASARGAAEQAQKAADAKGLTAAGSRDYRRGLVAISRARKVSNSGQSVDGLSAYWQATDLFARAEFDASAAATSGAGEKPAPPAPPVVTAPAPGPAAAGTPTPSPSVLPTPPPVTPPPSSTAARPAEPAEADSKPLNRRPVRGSHPTSGLRSPRIKACAPRWGPTRRPTNSATSPRSGGYFSTSPCSTTSRSAPARAVRAGGGPAIARPSRWTASGPGTWRGGGGTRCRVARRSGSRSPARWRPTRGCCCSTSRSRPWTSASRRTRAPCCWGSRARSRARRSSSRTTSWTCWCWPTGSWCSPTAASSRTARWPRCSPGPGRRSRPGSRACTWSRAPSWPPGRPRTGRRGGRGGGRCGGRGGGRGARGHRRHRCGPGARRHVDRAARGG